MKASFHKYRHHRHVVLEAMKGPHGANAFKYASRELRTGQEMILQALSLFEPPNLNDYFSLLMKKPQSETLNEKDDEILSLLLKLYPSAFLKYYFHSSAATMRTTPNAITKYLSNDLHVVEDSLQVLEKALILKAMSFNPKALLFVPPSYLYDREVILTAVKANGSCLSNAEMARHFLDDEEIVRQVLANETLAHFSLASPNLRNNKEFVMSILSSNPSSFVYASKRLRSDREELIRQAVQQVAGTRFSLEEIEEICEEARQMAPQSSDFELFPTYTRTQFLRAVCVDASALDRYQYQFGEAITNDDTTMDPVIVQAAKYGRFNKVCKNINELNELYLVRMNFEYDGCDIPDHYKTLRWEILPASGEEH
nr:unnamed protein product [Naegleria fowleri]